MFLKGLLDYAIFEKFPCCARKIAQKVASKSNNPNPSWLDFYCMDFYFAQLSCPVSKGAFRICNFFLRNFLVAQDILPGKLQAIAIILTRRGWIFIAWIFIARNFLPSVCFTFIEGGCGTLSIDLLSFLKGSIHYLNSCLFCSVHKVVISIGTTNTVWSKPFIIFLPSISWIT